jgi:hypothetical protein
MNWFIELEQSIKDYENGKYKSFDSVDELIMYLQGL